MLRRLFGAAGRDFRFDPNGSHTLDRIFVGDHVNLGMRPLPVATRADTRIGNHVMFGPEVTTRGGNHRSHIVGRFMYKISDAEKRAVDDLGVRIEDDVWIGTRAIILHGVTIGRGAVIGAGVVVTRSILRYAIAGGVPALVIGFRWSVGTIMTHEILLYPVERRLSRVVLEESRRGVESRP